jgi:hypothetical protein
MPYKTIIETKCSQCYATAQFERLYVVCPDGEQRHEEPFKSFDEAWRWVQWGHACLGASDHWIWPEDFVTSLEVGA